jgi:WXG100 family type VII secretion target
MNEVTPGSSQFTVDLEQFSDAITTVTTCQNAISQDYSQIQSELTAVADAWSSPAGQSYEDVQSALNSAMQNLEGLLAEILTRMQQTYQNYQDTEQTNSTNLT